jgi:hypothetical protein
MNAYFADTYFFIALLNPHDEAHRRAVEFNASLRRRLVTTAWVVTELADGLAGTPARQLFSGFRRRLIADRRFTIVPPDMEAYERGLALYESHTDKRWSLTDCISFEIMRDHRMREALTADHHFEQAGFVALLRSDP